MRKYYQLARFAPLQKQPNLKSKSTSSTDKKKPKDVIDLIMDLHQAIGNRGVLRLIDSNPSFDNTIHGNTIHKDQNKENVMQRRSLGATIGQPLPESVRALFESRFGDLSAVRVHENASDIAQPLGARAVTRGQDIYFHPGQFSSNTAAGRDLLAHELAHTLQTRQSEDATGSQTAFVSRPGDALEKNADALAHGQTTHVLAAPTGAALRSPLDKETPEARVRRDRLLQSISNARKRLLNLRQSGDLIKGLETETERAGIRGVIYAQPPELSGTFASYAERDARVDRIIRVLIAMETLYQRTPIPTGLSEPKLVQGEYHSEVSITQPETEYHEEYTSKDVAWAELQAVFAYYRYTVLNDVPHVLDKIYPDPSNIVVPGHAPRISSGTPSGAYIVVPDIQKPLDYRLVSGFESAPPGSVVLELWHDDFGYYYTHKDRRIYVRSPWR